MSDHSVPCRICGSTTAPGAAVSRRAFLRGLAATGAAVPIAGCGQVDIGWRARRLVPPDTEAELGR